jgi:hypothetical protein
LPATGLLGKAKLARERVDRLPRRRTADSAAGRETRRREGGKKRRAAVRHLNLDATGEFPFGETACSALIHQVVSIVDTQMNTLTRKETADRSKIHICQCEGNEMLGA